MQTKRSRQQVFTLGFKHSTTWEACHTHTARASRALRTFSKYLREPTNGLRDKTFTHRVL